MSAPPSVFSAPPSQTSAATRVKNKTPAPRQITAEQIVREAKERQEEDFKYVLANLRIHAGKLFLQY